MKIIEIRTTLIYEAEIPFDDDHYPGMSLEEAIEFEKSPDGQEEQLLMLMEGTPPKFHTTEIIIREG